MTEASHLQPDHEYLLWWEAHRNRWVAAPVLRIGNVLHDVDYTATVTVHVTTPMGTEIRRAGVH